MVSGDYVETISGY